MYIKRQTGFSLIEIALSLLILGIAVAGFNGVFKFLFDADHVLEEQNNILKIERSLKTYLRVNMHLPCPDTSENGGTIDGREDRDPVTGICFDREGYLPYNDIGVSEFDAWKNHYYYRVHQRAASATPSVYNSYINDACEPPSVFGNTGALEHVNTSAISSLTYCPESATYYCNELSDVPTTACDSGTLVDDQDPRTVAAAPYYLLSTPPYGDVSGSFNLIINDEAGNALDAGIVAMVISWGADGDAVNRYLSSSSDCSQTSVDNGTIRANELENCNSDGTDRTFVDTRIGKNRDFLAWVTVNDAKMAYVSQPK